ncbi:MAG: hypothetical protein IH840_02415 [Candidatus Heimdallarchaeota archaeon]|nr:hypothetical protein [Candidatus Heimdallarchaeota archaeon]
MRELYLQDHWKIVVAKNLDKVDEAENDSETGNIFNFNIYSNHPQSLWL